MNECKECEENVDHFCKRRGGVMKTRELPLRKYRVEIGDMSADTDASSIEEAARKDPF